MTLLRCLSFAGQFLDGRLEEYVIQSGRRWVLGVDGAHAVNVGQDRSLKISEVAGQAAVSLNEQNLLEEVAGKQERDQRRLNAARGGACSLPSAWSEDPTGLGKLSRRMELLRNFGARECLRNRGSIGDSIRIL